jgi:hypothetical protein
MREAERAEIIQAEDVVGMGMGIEDGVDVSDAEAQRLLAEIRPSVDEDAVRRGGIVVLPLDRNGGTQALVAGISGGADAAGAAQCGHTHRGAAAEKQDAGFVGQAEGS